MGRYSVNSSFLLSLCIVRGDCTSNIWPTPLTTRIAFAAGGFGSKKTPLRAKKKKRPKKLTDAILQKKSTTPLPSDSEPKLDRFGFPIPTTDDFMFPPMPPETEIIPASAGRIDDNTSQEDLDKILENHISVNISSLKKCPGGEDMKVRILHRSPPVISIDNFFTPEECQECIELSEASTEKKAMQVNSATFSPLAQSKRTSTTWFCYYSQMPTLLSKVKSLLGIPIDQFEEPQVVRYRTGEQFSWHYDEIPAAQLNNGGQRVATLLVYLNTLGSNKGGGTVFRDLYSPSGEQLTMRPKTGSLLIFFPAFKDGRPDDRTLHKGEVALDEKMISQMWIHERPYSPAVPEGNSHGEARELVAAKEVELGLT